MSRRRNSTRYVRKERAAGKRFAVVLLPEAEEVLARQRYYGRMLEGLSAGLLERGIRLRPVQCLHVYQKEHFLATPPNFYVGVAVLGPLYTSELFLRAVVERLGGPKVMLDHYLDDIPMHSVREDAVAGMRMVTEHLISLGHREIAYLDLGNPEGNPWKREGVNMSLRDAGLEVLGRGRVAGCRPNEIDVATALDWFEGLDPRPTAVICSDDTRALLMRRAAVGRGLRVPGDLSVTGFGDYAVYTAKDEPLTSMAVDADRMGREAAALIAGDPEAKPVSVLVPPDLVARSSTGAPAPRGEQGKPGDMDEGGAGDPRHQ